MNDILSPDNLAHHRTASSLNYKEWDFSDVSAWLEEHLKIPQYKEVFCKYFNSIVQLMRAVDLNP
jgi:hypothetical protein